MKRELVQIVWFKRDLRVFDNIVLSKACMSGTVLPLYIFEPVLWRQPDHSYRHYLFLKQAIKDLDNQLQKFKSSSFSWSEQIFSPI